LDWKPELHLGSDKNLTLFGDGIEYHDPKNKSDGYTVIEGATDTSIIISYSETQNHHKNAKRTGRQEQSDKEVKKLLLDTRVRRRSSHPLETIPLLRSDGDW
jgi:hypothetical protein